jgi:hypothetical protein
MAVHKILGQPPSQRCSRLIVRKSTKGHTEDAVSVSFTLVNKIPEAVNVTKRKGLYSSEF